MFNPFHAFLDKKKHVTSHSTSQILKNTDFNAIIKLVSVNADIIAYTHKVLHHLKINCGNYEFLKLITPSIYMIKVMWRHIQRRQSYKIHILQL